MSFFTSEPKTESKTYMVTCQFPKEEKDAFAEACKEYGVKQAAVMRIGLEKLLEGDDDIRERMVSEKESVETKPLSLKLEGEEEKDALDRVCEDLKTTRPQLVRATVASFMDEVARARAAQ